MRAAVQQGGEPAVALPEGDDGFVQYSPGEGPGADFCGPAQYVPGIANDVLHGRLSFSKCGSGDIQPGRHGVAASMRETVSAGA